MVLCRESGKQSSIHHTGPPVQRPKWLKKPYDMSQIPELLEMIASLRQKGISGESLAFDWMKRRIQPLQARVTFGFEY